MEHCLSPLVKSIFIENTTLSFFLDMCIFLTVSRKISTVFGLSAAVALVLDLSVPVNQLVYSLLRDSAIAEGVDLTPLKPIIFIGMIAALVQILGMFSDKFFSALYNVLNIYLSLIIVSCAISGAVLFMAQYEYNLGKPVVYDFGAGLGQMLAIIVLASITERMRYSDTPKDLKELDITFVSVDLMAVALMSLSGIQL